MSFDSPNRKHTLLGPGHLSDIQAGEVLAGLRLYLES